MYIYIVRIGLAHLPIIIITLHPPPTLSPSFQNNLIKPSFQNIIQQKFQNKLSTQSFQNFIQQKLHNSLSTQSVQTIISKQSQQ